MGMKKPKRSKKAKALSLSLATLMSVSVMTPVMMESAHAARYNSVAEYIMANWKNYPSINHQNFDGGWGFTGDTLYTSRNIHWTGYFNTLATHTRDGVYEFSTRLNGAHADPYGWTFRHREIANNQYSFYAVEIGPYHREITLARINSWIPSSSDPVHGGPLYHGTVNSADGHYHNHGGGNRQSNALRSVNGTVLGHARINYQFHRWDDIKIENTGNRIKVWYNGQLVIDVVDANPLPNGGYGPYTASQYQAEFKNISVNGVNFLNIPPDITITNATEFADKRFAPGDSVPIKGFVQDYDNTPGLSVQYWFNNGSKQQAAGHPTVKGRFDFDTNIIIPHHLSYGWNSVDVWGQDGEGAESVPQRFRLFIEDIKPPTISITGNPSAWTKNNATLNINAFDYESGMKRIQLPNGTWVNGSTASFTVTENGNYTFVAEDQVGNQTTQGVYVSKIDKTPPSVPFLDGELNLVSMDYGSVVKDIFVRLNGGNWQKNPDLQKLGIGHYNMEMYAVDNAGNESDIGNFSFSIMDAPPDNSAEEAVIHAEAVRTQKSVDDARVLVNQLPDSDFKESLHARLDVIQSEINSGMNLEDLINTIIHLIDNATTLPECDYIQGLINELPAGESRNEVQVLLNLKRAYIIQQMDYDKALQAVMDAESGKTQNLVDIARSLVNRLPDSDSKQDLHDRLDAIQMELYGDDETLKEIEEAVQTAEYEQSQSSVDYARSLVATLPEGEARDSFTARLDEVQKIIDYGNILDILEQLEVILSAPDVSAEDILYAESVIADINENRHLIPSHIDQWNLEYRIVSVTNLIPIAKEIVLDREIAKAIDLTEIAEFDRTSSSVNTAESQVGITWNVLDSLLNPSDPSYAGYADILTDLEERLALIRLEVGDTALLDAQRLLAEARDAVEHAEDTRNRQDIATARDALNIAEDAIAQLPESDEKTELEEAAEGLRNRLESLEEELRISDALAKEEALRKIIAYEQSRYDGDRQIAQDAVSAIENDQDRYELQEILNGIEQSINSPSLYEIVKVDYRHILEMIYHYGETGLESDREIAQDAINGVEDENIRNFLQNLLDTIRSDEQIKELIEEIMDMETDYEGDGSGNGDGEGDGSGDNGDDGDDGDGSDIDPDDYDWNEGYILELIGKYEESGKQSDKDKAQSEINKVTDDVIRDYLQDLLDSIAHGNDTDNEGDSGNNGNNDNNNGADDTSGDGYRVIISKRDRNNGEGTGNDETITSPVDLTVLMPYTAKPHVEVETGFMVENGERSNLKKAVFTEAGVFQISFETPSETLAERIRVVDVKPQMIRFSDIQNHWGERFIQEIGISGIANGFPDGTFKPNAPISVGDTFTFLNRTLILNDMYQTSADRARVKALGMNESHWAFYSVADIFTRISDETIAHMFSREVAMDRAISRQELAQIIYETAGHKLANKPGTTPVTQFADAHRIDPMHMSAMRHLVDAGIIVGRSNNGEILLAPDAQLTRAELMTVIKKINDIL